MSKVLEKYGIHPEIPFILTLNAFSPHKNLKTLIESIFLLDRQVPNLDFKLIITGKINAHIKSLLNNYPLTFVDKRIIMVGFVKDEDLAIFYSACSAFVFPSLYEGFGYPLLEAMACGAPIVYSNSSSLPEIAGNSGFACNPLIAEDFSEKLLYLLNDDRLRSLQSEFSINRAKRFSLNSNIISTENLYRKIIKA